FYIKDGGGGVLLGQLGLQVVDNPTVGDDLTYSQLALTVTSFNSGSSGYSYTTETNVQSANWIIKSSNSFDDEYSTSSGPVVYAVLNVEYWGITPFLNLYAMDWETFVTIIVTIPLYGSMSGVIRDQIYDYQFTGWQEYSDTYLLNGDFSGAQTYTQYIIPGCITPC
ncbi:MAG: hypothetical protein M1148_00115, partial [Candidatus Thermoplasmatota archaeon]|nr:hypothetical protein [Candidatus Thermoplasmatota archaeon]